MSHLLLLRLLGIVKIRQRHARKPLPKRPLDGFQVTLFVIRDKRKRISARRCPAGASHAVDVIIGQVGAVKVDDVTDVGDVNAAGRDVSGDEHPEAAIFESRQRRRPLPL